MMTYLRTDISQFFRLLKHNAYFCHNFLKFADPVSFFLFYQIGQWNEEVSKWASCSGGDLACPDM